MKNGTTWEQISSSSTSLEILSVALRARKEYKEKHPKMSGWIGLSTHTLKTLLEKHADGVPSDNDLGTSLRKLESLRLVTRIEVDNSTLFDPINDEDDEWFESVTRVLDHQRKQKSERRVVPRMTARSKSPALLRL